MHRRHDPGIQESRQIQRWGRSCELIVFQMIGDAEIPMEKKNDQIIETAVEARAGFLGRPVLLVLVVSCVLAAI